MLREAADLLLLALEALLEVVVPVPLATGLAADLEVVVPVATVPLELLELDLLLEAVVPVLLGVEETEELLLEELFLEELLETEEERLVEPRPLLVTVLLEELLLLGVE